MDIPMDPNPAQPQNSAAAPAAPLQSPNPPKMPDAQAVGTSGVRGKEIESGVGLGDFEIPELAEIGKDIELPKEVKAAGVKMKPANVSVSKQAQSLGVTPIGQRPVSQQPVKAQSVPLSDDEIVQGMKQGVKSSWRWLAEWCMRKLKQLHGALKNVGGKT